MISLLISTAMAQDIQPVAPGETVTAETQSFLLPEAKYDKCLTAAKNVPVLEEALDQCTKESLEFLQRLEPKFDLFLDHLDFEDETSDAVLANIQEVKAANEDLVKENRRLRNQRNMLLAAGGTLFVTGATAAAVVIATR